MLQLESMTDLSIRHILFPYDFSEQGRQAMPFVAAFARRFSAQLTLFTVASHEQKTEIQRWLDESFLDEFQEVFVRRVASCGDAALRIVDFAHNLDVDLVMMPTHGMGMFRRVLAGSVTSKVLHDVKCPVWTSAHAERQCAPVAPRTILCAVDACTEGVALLQYAALLSRALHASLKVLHVVEPITYWASLGSERALQEDAREMLRGGRRCWRRQRGVKVVAGDIDGRQAAREDRADLLVVGDTLARAFGRIRTHTFGISSNRPAPSSACTAGLKACD
jgi:nucleotide-binding universal stress UspA family protein